MSVRKWFGLEDRYYLKNKINWCLDELLNQYHQALHNYFEIEDSKDVMDFKKKVNEKNLEKHDEIFVEWLFKEGIPAFKILNNTILDDPQLIASLEYQLYILEPELDMEYPDDLRDCLITIPNSITEYFSSYNEISSTQEEIDNINDKVMKFLQENVLGVQVNKENFYMPFDNIKSTDITTITTSFNEEIQLEINKTKQDYIKRTCQKSYCEEYLGSAYQKAEPFFWKEISIHEYRDLQTV
ncbi:hypothetical protein CHCC20333_3303 [Bacillus paralicheniformis]|uniref:hypothetical protein n=1 Tax=Bacillus paralicheniformis TaxID=1648923 RepID=UPI0011BF58B1|nr:hypothetical protein [Bacillus paralicheniformis]TWK86261.1 hypothetical protein CHCC20333_3303 [Bacillus paralicheniformis]